MNDNLSRAGLTLLIIISIVLSVAYVKHLADQEPQIVYIEEVNIPSVHDIQRRLKSVGHNIKIDGIIGPETITAWDKQICQQEFEKSVGLLKGAYYESEKEMP